MNPEQLLAYIETEVTESLAGYGSVYTITCQNQTIIVDFDPNKRYVEYHGGYITDFRFNESLYAININDVDGKVPLTSLIPGSDHWISEVKILLNLIDIIQRAYSDEVIDQIKQKLKEDQ